MHFMQLASLEEEVLKNVEQAVCVKVCGCWGITHSGVSSVVDPYSCPNAGGGGNELRGCQATDPGELNDAHAG
jgi:hypothetical protein